MKLKNLRELLDKMVADGVDENIDLKMVGDDFDCSYRATDFDLSFDFVSIDDKNKINQHGKSDHAVLLARF